MFPNPQDALPLPPQPNLEQYKKQAKELAKACKSGDPGALGAWAANWVKTLARLHGLVITRDLPVSTDRWTAQVEEFARRKLQNSGQPATCSLADAQFVIARAHGYENWHAFSAQITAQIRHHSPESQFEAAVETIVANASHEQMVRGFLWACGFGHNDVVAFLMAQGVDLATQDADGQTGLHWAAMNGQSNSVQFLLARGAPLEVRNVYAGTVLGQTLWAAAHADDPDAYIPIVETLLVAGARVPERHAPISWRMDGLLLQKGSAADDSLSWDGE